MGDQATRNQTEEAKPGKASAMVAAMLEWSDGEEAGAAGSVWGLGRGVGGPSGKALRSGKQRKVYGRRRGRDGPVVRAVGEQRVGQQVLEQGWLGPEGQDGVCKPIKGRWVWVAEEGKDGSKQVASPRHQVFVEGAANKTW